MCKFFYPCGAKEISRKDEFISFYNDKYFLREDGERNNPIQYKIANGRSQSIGQSSRRVEEHIETILRNGIMTKTKAMK